MNKTVYWAPYFENNASNWNLLFEEPFNLHKFNVENNKTNFDKNSRLKKVLLCPASNQLNKNTFVFKNPISTELEIQEGDIYYKSKNFYETSITDIQGLINYGLPVIMFCENDLEVTMTSPYSSHCPHLQHASLIPGKFNISKWFRPINFEFRFHNNKYFKIDKDEHMAYFVFNTDEEITLKRFEMNEKLLKIANTCSSSPVWEQFVPLYERYKRFTNSKTNKIVLNEIKKSIV